MYVIINKDLFTEKTTFKMLSKAGFSTLLFTKRAYSSVSGQIRAQKYVLTKYFQGEPKKSDFKIVEEELPQLKDGGRKFRICS